MHVVLLHGLFMNQWIMYPLGKQLAQAGFTPHYYNYASRAASPLAHAQHLHQWLQTQQLPPCYFVAHSLGGLIVRYLADIAPEHFAGRVVTIGSPHQGSQVAHRIHQHFPQILGKSWQNGLDGHLPEWQLPNIALGNIIGTSGAGLGWLLGDLPTPHDGTVAQCETALSGSVVCEIAAGHTQLLFHADTSAQVIHFLQHGKFKAA